MRDIFLYFSFKYLKMKLKTLLLFFIVNAGFLQAQNFSASYTRQPTCFGQCDGIITFTTNAVPGPFTAVVNNSNACPNSTVQNTNNNSITINSVCACAGIYTVTIYSGTVVVGNEIFQFPNYAAAPLVVSVNNITAESCSACCNGAANVSYTGGNVQGTPTFSIDGVPVLSVTPLTNLCSGDHTVCMTDASNCISCKVFNIPLLSGLNENTLNFPVSIFPNPAGSELFIESAQNNSISKVEIFSVAGSRISEFVVSGKFETKLKLDVKSLTQGLYYLSVYNSEGQLIQHKKFIKENN